MTTKTTDAPVLTPRLAALRDEYLSGGKASADDVLRAVADDYLKPWQAERAARQQAAAEAERKTWSTEVADFIATVLAADESSLFPKFTAFTSDPKAVVRGNPTVVIEPLSCVEHDGRGKASGKVSLTFHDVAAPDLKRLESVLDPHSTSKVGVGNWPVHSVRSDGWVLALPYIARPSAVSLATDIQRHLTRQHLSATGTWTDLGADVTIGESQTVQQSSEKVVLRGHLTATSSDPRHGAVLDNDAVIEAAKRAVRDISDSGAFVPGIGKVQSAEIVDTKRIATSNNKPALGIAFEVTATGRYDA